MKPTALQSRASLAAWNEFFAEPKTIQPEHVKWLDTLICPETKSGKHTFRRCDGPEKYQCSRCIHCSATVMQAKEQSLLQRQGSFTAVSVPSRRRGVGPVFAYNPKAFGVTETQNETEETEEDDN